MTALVAVKGIVTIGTLEWTIPELHDRRVREETFSLTIDRRGALRSLAH